MWNPNVWHAVDLDRHIPLVPADVEVGAPSFWVALPSPCLKICPRREGEATVSWDRGSHMAQFSREDMARGEWSIGR